MEEIPVDYPYPEGEPMFNRFVPTLGNHDYGDVGDDHGPSPANVALSNPYLQYFNPAVRTGLGGAPNTTAAFEDNAVGQTWSRGFFSSDVEDYAAFSESENFRFYDVRLGTVDGPSSVHLFRFRQQSGDAVCAVCCGSSDSRFRRVAEFIHRDREAWKVAATLVERGHGTVEERDFSPSASESAFSAAQGYVSLILSDVGVASGLAVPPSFPDLQNGVNLYRGAASVDDAVTVLSEAFNQNIIALFDAKSAGSRRIATESFDPPPAGGMSTFDLTVSN